MEPMFGLLGAGDRQQILVIFVRQSSSRLSTNFCVLAVLVICYISSNRCLVN